MTTQPNLTVVSNDASPPAPTLASPAKIHVTVAYGPAVQEFNVLDGLTVAQVLVDPFISETIGYNGSDVTTVTVNGSPASFGDVIRSGDSIEVIKRAGQKA